MAFTARTETYVRRSSLSSPYSFTINTAGGVQNGDIMFMYLMVYVSSPPTIDAAPDGWTEVATNTAGNSRWFLYYKIASSEGANYTWSLTKSCRYYALNIAYSSGDFDVTGLSGITAISNTLYGTAGQTVRAASMNVPDANSPLVYFASIYNTTARTFTKPTTPVDIWVEDADQGNATPDISTTNGSMIWTGYGDTGNIDIVCSTSITTNKHAFAIALKPPPPPSPSLSPSISVSSVSPTQTPSITPSPPVLTLLTNLVAYYKLDESSGTIIDSVGNNDSVAVGSTVSYGYPGKLGTALGFSGATNEAYVELPDVSDLQFETSDVTFGCWFNTTVTTQGGLIGGQDGSFALDTFHGGTNAVTFFLGNTNQMAYFFSLTCPINTWNFVAIIFDSTATTNNATLYLNGNTETITANFDGTAGAATNLIGQDAPASVQFYGSIDEVFIYKGRKLTVSDLDTLYNSGNGLTYPFTQPSPTPSLSISVTPSLSISPSPTPSQCITTVTDNFESYNTGALAGQGNWAQGGDTGGNIQVIDASGDARVASDGSLVDSVTYRTDVTSSDQYSQLVIEVTGSGQMGVVVRSTGSNSTATYLVYTVSGVAREFARIVNNSWTSVNAVATGVSAGDTIKISVIGTNVYVYLNGSLDTGLGGTGVYDISGYGITSGYPGIHTYSSADTIGDDWQGGCVITETTPSPTPSLSISATQTPSLSVSATQTPSLSISTTPSLSISTTPSLSISTTPSLSISATPSLSISATQTPSLSISATPSLSISATQTPSLSISSTPSLSISSTPSLSISSTPSLSISSTPSLSISSTPSLSISSTPSLSISTTPSLSISATRTPSITPTRTPSLSISSTPSLSISATRTPSITPTITPSISISPTRTPSLTPSPSFGTIYSHWAVKYSTSTVPNTIKNKNMVFGYNGDAEWGPTSITGFWNGIDPATSGYTIYYLTELRQEPIIYVVNTDDKCIFLAKQFGGTNINTISDAITYFSVTHPDTNIFNDSGIII